MGVGILLSQKDPHCEEENGRAFPCISSLPHPSSPAPSRACPRRPSAPCGTGTRCHSNVPLAGSPWRANQLLPTRRNCRRGRGAGRNGDGGFLIRTPGQTTAPWHAGAGGVDGDRAPGRGTGTSKQTPAGFAG